MSDVYERLLERYETGQVPWDQALPPPEVIELASHLPPGRALDLGAGYGRAAIYLAQRGWQVDAVDFVPQAVAGAAARAQAADVRGVTFHHGPITDMSFLDGPYDLALDVGCMHSLTSSQLLAYRNELRRLLRPGAVYLLFAHLREPGADEARWLDELLLMALWEDGFQLDKVERGMTQVADNPPWPSAWFWWRRVAVGRYATVPDAAGEPI